ncbi:MAG: hypothetical protein K9M98_14850 [Cephaloticoccus sp.]|nr:hypothetical protein [Cephaloticoccus sp.]MCF7761776.1 hypothetical protein [Cephaloticoccus sp.]
MPGLTLHTDAFVLLKQPPGDKFQTCTVFSEEHGTLLVMQRLPKAKPGGNAPAPLDLFDEATLILESSNQGRTWFVKECRLLNRAVGIGRSYAALVHASAFSALLARNHVSEESRGPVAALLRSAFAAFNTADRPDIAHFKALYCFARDEGYPIKQHWLPTLPAADRRMVTELLNQPIAGQTTAAASVLRLHNRLVEYLRGHTEILFD